VSHHDSLARQPIDPAMRNSFGNYSEPDTRNSYEAETSPMVRDADDVTPNSDGGEVKAWDITKATLEYCQLLSLLSFTYYYIACNLITFKTKKCRSIQTLYKQFYYLETIDLHYMTHTAA